MGAGCGPRVLAGRRILWNDGTSCRGEVGVKRARVSEEVVLPVPVARAWEYLVNTQRMVELDPLIESYEPETGVIAKDTTNQVVSRLGPLRMRLITRTAELDPPHRVVFENVKPNWPLAHPHRGHPRRPPRWNPVPGNNYRRWGYPHRLATLPGAWRVR